MATPRIPSEQRRHREQFNGRKRHPALPPGVGWFLYKHGQRGVWRAGRYYDDGQKVQQEFKVEKLAIAFIEELRERERTAFDVWGFLSRPWGAATLYNAEVSIYEFEC